jgi:sec-independent protein translocase protein TatB
VFGLGFGELVVVLLVAVVVLGPRELPRYMRLAGQWAGRLRRMAFDMRQKSGIDEVLRAEGFDRDLAEIRKLARGELDGVVAAVRSVPEATRAADVPASPYAQTQVFAAVAEGREYPAEGPDAYGAVSAAPAPSPSPALSEAS